MNLPTDTQTRANEHPGIGDTLARSVLLATTYFIAGWLGLQLAAPPGYVTLVWPASGIAVAALIMFGPRLAPGVLAGSMALHIYMGHDSGSNGADWAPVAIAAGIAVGSMLQAVAAAYAERKIFGVPLALKSKSSIRLLAFIVGPLACILGASVSVSALYFGGAIPAQDIIDHWVTWWTGNLIGILIGLPLA